MTYMTLADKALHDEPLTKEECHSVLNTTNDDLLALCPPRHPNCGYIREAP